MRGKVRDETIAKFKDAMDRIAGPGVTEEALAQTAALLVLADAVIDLAREGIVTIHQP